MDRVYIVTEGSYSDYHIVAVFSTEEQAKAFCAESKGAEFAEYPVDDARWNPGLGEYEFAFDLDGNIKAEEHKAQLLNDSGQRLELEQSDNGYLTLEKRHVYNGSDEPRVYITAFSASREKAVKIASEKYTRVRAHLDEAMEVTKRTPVDKLPERWWSSGSRTTGMEAEYDREEHNFNIPYLVAKVLAGVEHLGSDPKKDCWYDSAVRCILQNAGVKV
jgi:hypothetical protein